MNDRTKISADELEHRMNEQEKVHTIPVQKAVALLDEFLDEVVGTLGVDTTKDRASIEFQMQVMGIQVISISREESQAAAGIYVFDGSLNRVAFIKEMDVDANGKFAYKPAYWNKLKDDYDEPERIKIG